MKIHELFEPMQFGVYEPNSDSLNKAAPTDKVKKKIYLKDLNKLKKLRSYRQLEYVKQQDIVAVMYSKADDSGM
jgi:hypothetical protein